MNFTMPPRIALRRIAWSILLFSRVSSNISSSSLFGGIDVLYHRKMLKLSGALVAQWIEQPRPKGLMWVRFLPRALSKSFLRDIHREIREDEVGAGALDAAERFAHDAPLIDGACRCGEFD